MSMNALMEVTHVIPMLNVQTEQDHFHAIVIQDIQEMDSSAQVIKEIDLHL